MRIHEAARLDYFFLATGDSEVVSSRGYFSVNGVGGDEALDGFITTASSALNGISSFDVGRLSFKQKFIEIPDQNDANLLEGAVVSFKLDAPEDDRFWNCFIPGVPIDAFDEFGSLILSEDVNNFVQFALLFLCAPTGEALEQCVGGYRGFSRF